MNVGNGTLSARTPVKYYGGELSPPLRVGWRRLAVAAPVAKVNCQRIFVPLRQQILSSMKVKVTKKQVEKIVNDPEQAVKAGIKVGDPWWVIVLKAIAYIIGLILGGVATTSCALAMGIF